ncbi:peptidase, partial [Gemmatimonadota bacterium]
MGVEFDRILDGIEGPFEPIDEWNVSPPAGTVSGGSGVAGYLMSHRVNDAFRVINRLNARNIDVFWSTDPVDGLEAGAFYVPAGRGVAGLVNELAGEFGVDFTGVASHPSSAMLRLRPPRIALADEYGGSMASGWLRWVLEQWEYTDFDVVYPP